ncbi:ATP-binding protein [Caballeronia sp. LjRoot34]|uniref:ATP-binding protein n=1 Tax=Caballeronia sp. LjRoot34 TaxID=3342325 RepID=UPI003ED0B747
MSSPSILRLVRLMTLLVLVWAASGVSAGPLRVQPAKQTTQDYSTLTRDESQARRSEPIPGSTGTEQPQTLSLSADERAYLHSLPPLTLGVDASWAPFTYVDSSGESRGIAMAYASYLSKALDIDLERRVYQDWGDVLNAFARGQIDMVATTERETPRLAGGIPTGSVVDYPLVIVGRLGEPVMNGIEQASSRRIVVTARLAASGRLGNLPSGAALIIAPNLNAALDRVVRGKADLFVGDLVTVDIALAARYEDELKIVGPAGNFEHMSFALRPEFGRLVPLIDRALSAMSDADKQSILAVRRAALDPPASGWSVNAMRLLPALIAIAVVLAVTLRAFVLLQREMARRVETEQRLATQLSFQQTMMEVVPYPLVAKDRENRYIAVNRAFEKTLGLKREDIIGRTTLEVQSWGVDNSQRLHDLVGMSIEHGRREQIEITFHNRDGALRHGLFWTGAFAAANGAMAGVVGTMIDITDIRDAEMRARENERRLHDVTRSLPAVVFQLRRTKDGAYSFPYIGGDTRHLFGTDLAALGSDQVAGLSLIHADDKRGLGEAIERSALTLDPVHMEFRSIVDEGRHWIRAHLVAHREADGSVVWNGYWVDASVERARADELAAARDAAEAASRAKDDFLAMMSHEIRTPMNGVLGLVEVFENTPLNPDQSQMLGMIQDSASALLQILDDLLDYSKIEAGRLTIESMPIDLRELVDNAIGLLAGRAHEKGLRVRVDVSPDIAASLRGDSVRLRQVLFNLISNAIKFTMKGEVALTVNLVESAHGVQTVELNVEDTGIGIAAEAQASLFEPFVQAESSTTRRFGGTGLGLTICRKLVELMGGTLELQSQVGVGTRMIVRLDMPVETANYQIDGLRGKSGIIAIDDQRVARALVDYGQALGLKLAIRSSDDAALRDPHTFDGIDLVFLSDTHPQALPLKTRVIHVTEKPKPTGYRILDNDIRVSVNPISWRGLGAACVAALTGLPQLVSRATRGIDTNNEPPDRERAIRMGRLVLVAEDHPVNQELIRHQLALLGFACDVVQDGVEALAALKQTHYGFLITDCHMPNMTGYELARRVRASELGLSKRLPILGITASTAPEELSMCRDAGMDDCFIKPTRLVTLRDHLNRWRVMDSASAAPEPVVVEERDVDTFDAETDEIDLDYMTQLWGSGTTVKALLDAFVSSFRDDLDTLRTLLNGGSVAQLREWHHRVIGAASILQYRPLQIALDRFRRDLVDKPDGLRRQDGAALIVRCEVLLERIEAQRAEMA